MLTVRGKFQDGIILLVEDVPFSGKHDVLVTFLGTDAGIVVAPKGEHEDLLKQACRFRFSLTNRELEVLQLIQMGLTNKKIADTLGLSRGTIRNLASSIYRKLGVSNRTEASRRAIETGLIKINSPK